MQNASKFFHRCVGAPSKIHCVASAPPQAALAVPVVQLPVSEREKRGDAASLLETNAEAVSVAVTVAPA